MKKLIALFLSLILIIGVIPFGIFAGNVDDSVNDISGLNACISLGNINGDTTIDTVDLSMLKSMLAGVEVDEADSGSANLNGDSVVDTVDLSELKLILAGVKDAPKATHKFSDTVTQPTCLGEGYTTHTCDYCGASYVDGKLAANGHSWGDWYVTEEITATSNGKWRHNCMNCVEFEIADIETLSTGNLGRDSAGNKTADIKYTVFADGTLKLVGNGQTYDCAWDGSKQPYVDNRADIKRVIIGDGITQTNGGVFAYLENLEYVYYPATLKTIGNNTFMGSYPNTVTSLVIPETVESVGQNAYGKWLYGNNGAANFTEITVLNPDTVFANTNCFNSGGSNSSITFYSYGETNKVKDYADSIGAAYIDLDQKISGTAENVNYEFSNGKLSFTTNLSNVSLPREVPWLDIISPEMVTSAYVGEGITEIPGNFFTLYTSLQSVEISNTVTKIGNGAFYTKEPCDVPLEVTIPESVTDLGNGLFLNRSNVTVNAFEGSAAASINEDGVTVNINRSYRLLLIGNSLTLDAADCSAKDGGTSQLYSIIKSMLGKNSFVEIGVLYAGAKTAAWHATVAEQGRTQYYLYTISDDTDGQWKVIKGGDATTVDGLTFRDWDYVTIQPYSTETETGTADGENDVLNKFLPLSESLPYLLDKVNQYAPNAKTYYYLPWKATNQCYNLDTAADGFMKMADTAQIAETYKGTSGYGFSGVVNVGTAIQNARRTYLAVLQHNIDGNTSQVEVVRGLSRDWSHLNYTFGRYIAGLTFAEILVPKDIRVKNYVLPNVVDSPEVGKLPLQYTEISKFVVQKAVESISAAGKDKYKPATFTEYKTNPINSLDSVAYDNKFVKLSVSDISELENYIKQKYVESAPADAEISVSFDNTPILSSSYESYSATVTARYGYTVKKFTVSGSVILN